MACHPLLIAATSLKGLFIGDVCEGLNAALVVRAIALVVGYGHRSISLEVGHWDDGCVHGDLMIVGAETVTVSVRVREQTRLKDGVSRRFDVRD